jgi:hypothetical protein
VLHGSRLRRHFFWLGYQKVTWQLSQTSSSGAGQRRETLGVMLLRSLYDAGPGLLQLQRTAAEDRGLGIDVALYVSHRWRTGITLILELRSRRCGNDSSARGQRPATLLEAFANLQQLRPVGRRDLRANDIAVVVSAGVGMDYRHLHCAVSGRRVLDRCRADQD